MHDALPEQAFYMVGTIGEAADKGARRYDRRCRNQSGFSLYIV